MTDLMRINTALTSRLLGSTHAFGGGVHGDDGELMDIEFPNLLMAARYVEFNDIADRTRLRDEGDGVTVSTFDRTVVIQIRITD